MGIDNEILAILSKLHNRFKFSLLDIQFIFVICEILVRKIYYNILLENFESTLFKAVDNEVSNEIKLILEKTIHTFEKFNTEKKRLTIYKQMDLFVEPQVNILSTSICTR